MGARKKRDLDMSEFFGFLSKAQPQQSADKDGHPLQQPGESNDDTLGEDIDYVYGDDYAQEQDDSYVYDGGSDSAAAAAAIDSDEDQREDEQRSYDPNNDLPDFDAQGTYSLELVGQRQLLSRQRRGAVNHLELPEATQGTLLAHVDHSQLLHPPSIHYVTSLATYTLILRYLTLNRMHF